MGFDLDGNEVGDNRPTRYIETADDGTEKVIYRASSLSNCTRRVLAQADGTWPAEPLPQMIRQAMDEGTAAESIIDALWSGPDYTGIPSDEGSSQSEVDLYLGDVDGREVYVRCHVDATAVDADGHPVLREYKKFRDSTWTTFLSKGIETNANYPWQVAVYMYAFELDTCEFVGGHMEGWADDFETVPNITELAVKYITNPPVPLKAIRDRVLGWERKIAAGMVGGDVDCDRVNYPCPYYKFHDDKPELDAWTSESKVLAVKLREFGQLTAEITKARAAMKPAEDRKKVLAEEIKALVAEEGDAAVAATRISAGGITVKRTRSHYPEKVRAAYDTDVLAIDRKATAPAAANSTTPDTNPKDT